MNRFRSKLGILFVIVVIFVFIPIVIATISATNVFKWMNSDNDWIGFWGSYLGGIFTLAGVFATITYTKSMENEKQKLLIRPYLTIEEAGSFPAKKPLPPIGIDIDFCDSESNNNGIFIGNLSIIKMISNIGLGSAIQCRVSDFSIENRKIHGSTQTASAMAVNDSIILEIQFNNINVSKDDISNRLMSDLMEIVEKRKSNSYEVKVEFSFTIHFEDLIGTKLKQKVVFYRNVPADIPVSIYQANMSLHQVEKPIEA